MIRRCRSCSGHAAGMIAALAAFVLVALAGTGAASAASLGGVTTAKLTAGTVAASTGAPTVLAWENFNALSLSAIAGTTTDGGGDVWSVNPLFGVWQVSANQATSASTDSSIVIDPGAFNETTVATVFRNGATTFDAGLTVDRNSAGTQFLSCEWTSATKGSMELWKYDGGTWTSLGAVTNLSTSIPSAPASIQLGCSTTATGISASINGITVVSSTLTAAEQTTFKNSSHRLTGPYQYTSNGITWDDLHVNSP